MEKLNKAKIAKILAEVHDKVMEAQEALQDMSNDSDSDDPLYDDLESVLTDFDSLEATTSDLDCTWNNYDTDIDSEEDDEDADA